MISVTEKQYNYTILVFRLIAIVCIVLCHIGTELEIAFIAQLLDVGVQFFLFISGYLYSLRSIQDPKKWIKKRYVRVTIPCLIYVIICILLSPVFKWGFSPVSIVLYPLNAEGYYHVFEFLPHLQLITGTQHLWFVTALFLCYILTVYVKQNEEIIHSHRSIILAIAFPVSFILTLIGCRMDLVFVYFMGYVMARGKKETTWKRVVESFVLMSVFIVGRLWMKSYCDLHGDHILYTNAIIPWTYIAITLFAYCLLSYFIPRIQETRIGGKVIQSWFFKKCDSLSFYLYISHYVFLGTELSIFRSGLNRLIQFPIYLIIIIIASIILQIISEWVINVMKKK